jgi:hypothetical protein
MTFDLEFPIWNFRLRSVCLSCPGHNEFAVREGPVDPRKQAKFYKGRSQEKHFSVGRNFSCFAARLIERDLF